MKALADMAEMELFVGSAEEGGAERVGQGETSDR